MTTHPPTTSRPTATPTSITTAANSAIATDHDDDHDQARVPGSSADLPATMTGVVQREFGGPETLELLRDAPVPRPAAGEVLVAVEAAGIDRGVWHLMAGLPYAVRVAGFGVRRPRRTNPGMDLAGRVVAVGEGVTRLRIGDEVAGLGIASFAEFAVANESKLTARPPAVGPVVAAALPNSGITALQAVREHARVETGQRVLVLGASGGVGSYAVQLAKLAGAHVTGVASEAKLDFVRSLGADEVVDYRAGDPLAGRYDVIIDIGGLHPVRRLRRALQQRGTLVIVGGENGGRWTGGTGRQLRAALLSPFVPQRLVPMMAKERSGDVATLLDLVASGDLIVPVDRTVPLADVAAAVDDLAAGRIRGKAVVTVD